MLSSVRGDWSMLWLACNRPQHTCLKFPFMQSSVKRLENGVKYDQNAQFPISNGVIQNWEMGFTRFQASGARVRNGEEKERTAQMAVATHLSCPSTTTQPNPTQPNLDLHLRMPSAMDCRDTTPVDSQATPAVAGNTRSNASRHGTPTQHDTCCSHACGRGVFALAGSVSDTGPTSWGDSIAKAIPIALRWWAISTSCADNCIPAHLTN